MDTTYQSIRHREMASAGIGTSARVLTAVAFVVSGILFVAYPVLRPFSSETGIEGARAFASNGWVVAHSLALAGSIALGLGLLGTYRDATPALLARGWAPAGAWARAGSVLAARSPITAPRSSACTGWARRRWPTGTTLR